MKPRRQRARLAPASICGGVVAVVVSRRRISVRLDVAGYCTHHIAAVAKVEVFEGGFFSSPWPRPICWNLELNQYIPV